MGFEFVDRFNLEGIQRLVSRDPSLARCHYAYRTPLYFAVRENRIEAVRFLLAREPKESILKTFDLSVIKRYFPEYDG